MRLSQAQPEDGANYAEKVMKSEAHIDWESSSGLICRRIRAFNPFPTSPSVIHDTTIKFWEAESVKLETDDAAPGSIVSIDDGIVVAAGIGAIRATMLQKPGKGRMNWRQFLQSFPLKVGETFK